MPEQARKVVVLLHGLGRSSMSMWLLARFLRKRGFETINHNYSSLTYTIEEQASFLHESLNRQDLAGSELYFLTHSMGSIIFRVFQASYGHGYHIHRVVMLGPPNQGSKYARFVSKTRLLNPMLGPGFRALSRAKNLWPEPSGIEIGIIAGYTKYLAFASYFILGPSDGIVAIEETRLESAKDHIVVNGLHSYLMFYPKVMKLVSLFFRTGNFGGKSNEG